MTTRIWIRKRIKFIELKIKNTSIFLVILGFIILIILSREYSRMAQVIGIRDSLISIVVLALIITGIVFWFRKAKGGKDRIKKL